MGIVAFILAALCLELLRWRTGHDLVTAGYEPWGGNGIYMRDFPGHSLDVTSLQSQIFLLLACLPVGLVAAVLCAIAAMLDMHLPFAAVSGATLPVFLLLPLSGGLVYIVTLAQPCLRIDLDQGVISVTQARIAAAGATPAVDIATLNLSRFDSYWVSAGENDHLELGAVLTDGQEVGLMPVPVAFFGDKNAAGQQLTAALQDFVSSNGQMLPAG